MEITRILSDICPEPKVDTDGTAANQGKEMVPHSRETGTFFQVLVLLIGTPFFFWGVVFLLYTFVLPIQDLFVG